MIIGINGRIGSGKDTVGKIIQYLTRDIKCVTYSFDEYCEYFSKVDKNIGITTWEIKKFADKLKDIVCLLTGCTRKQLEDQEFKSKELGEEWWYYRISSTVILPRFYYPNPDDNAMCEQRYLIKPTYRNLLQQIGTDLFRDKLHQNVWVNSLMNEYKKNELSHYKLRESGKEYYDEDPVYKYPNWIITDLRFPNELKAIKDRGGISIRVKRPQLIPRDFEHESETALDNAVFDYEINNDGTIEELIEKVRVILIKEKLI